MRFRLRWGLLRLVAFLILGIGRRGVGQVLVVGSFGLLGVFLLGIPGGNLDEFGKNAVATPAKGGAPGNFSPTRLAFSYFAHQISKYFEKIIESRIFI